MKHGKRAVDFNKRMEQKMHMRAEDIAALKSGEASQSSLRESNFCLHGLDFSKVVVKDSYGIEYSF